jgi:spermidine synthase
MKGPADAKNGKDAAAAPREGRRELRELLNPGQGMFYYAGDTLVEARTAYQRAEIVDSEALGRVLLLDGVSQLAERWEYRYHEPMVHPALLAHPNPRTVLVIGGGDGGVLREVLLHKTVERVDFAELDEEVVAFCRRELASVHRGAFDDPRVRFRFGDGRAFVEGDGETYDAIIMDMTDPMGPSRFLYTKEFFLSVRRRLAGDAGVFVMHGESPITRPVAYACIGATLRSAFPLVRAASAFVPMYGTLWSYRYASVSTDPQALSPGDVSARIGSRMSAFPVYTTGALWPALFAPDPACLQAEAHGDGRVITDERPDFPDAFNPLEGWHDGARQ